MSTTPARPNTSLSSYVDAIEAIDAERKELAKERAQILKDADAKGYTKTILQAVIRRRTKERAEVLQDDEELRAFEQELGMEVLK